MQPARTQPPSYDILFDQMGSQVEQARMSARIILQLLFERYFPQSVLDIGCGIGTWLAVSRELGVAAVQGVDGPWLDRARLIIEPDLVYTTDLTQPLALGRRFDLAICLETAEHLPSTASETIVETLVRHAPVVLFSAAIPYQRGPGHVNEQWPNYWVERFARYRYAPLDFLRQSIWYDDRVLWWYRQNILLFVDFDWCCSQPRLQREGEIQNLRLQPISVVLPAFSLRLRRSCMSSKRHYCKEATMHWKSMTTAWCI